LIEKKNIDYVHHIVITTCPDVTEADVGTSFECYHHHTPRRFQTCSEAVVAWAVGGVVSMMYIIDILLPWKHIFIVIARLYIHNPQRGSSVYIGITLFVRLFASFQHIKSGLERFKTMKDKYDT